MKNIKPEENEQVHFVLLSTCSIFVAMFNLILIY